MCEPHLKVFKIEILDTDGNSRENYFHLEPKEPKVRNFSKKTSYSVNLLLPFGSKMGQRKKYCSTFA